MTADLLSGPETLTGPSVAGPVLHLFGGPHVSVDGCRREVPEGSERLLSRYRCGCGPAWPGAELQRALLHTVGSRPTWCPDPPERRSPRSRPLPPAPHHHPRTRYPVRRHGRPR